MSLFQIAIIAALVVLLAPLIDKKNDNLSWKGKIYLIIGLSIIIFLIDRFLL
ncbi:hypothetical protein [Oceanobacillus kimchii]|uniref:hypothetical protein n=1 Tax=Oceanobacillus kimchii TaxID=746691 RepID=UPI001589F5D6|nr:hypothetical protein [Oceanobacillus kimchii]